MLTILIAVTAAASAALITYAALWLITDARERKRDAEMADRFLAHRRSLDHRYLRNDESRPE